MTDYVCHTAPVENAVNIFKCGSLQALTKWRGVSSSVLKEENSQAGDRLVMERKMKRFPIEADLSVDFTPGVRFFFKYDKIVTHPNATFEGVLPLKIREEVIISDWVNTIIIPSAEKEAFEAIVPYELKSRIFYLENDCKDIWSWAEKVYEFVKNRER